MNPVIMALLIFGAIFVCLFLCYFGYQMAHKENVIKQRVQSIEHETDLQSGIVVETQARPDARKSELSDSFKSRILIPLMLMLSEGVQKVIPTNGKSFIREKLVHAGYPKPQHFKTFMGVQLVAVAIPLSFDLLLTVMGRIELLYGLIGFPVAIILGLMFPFLWLVDNASKRQKAIQRALPDFLDLLVISVEAGMGMDVAIMKISKLESLGDSAEWRNELFKYTGDINMGKSRRDALQDLADRVGLEDLNSLAGALIQAFEMGTGVGPTLRIQSDTLRSKRLFRAEESAAKVATTMVLPTYAFFFPAIFIVMLGPMIMDAISKISGMMAK